MPLGSPINTATGVVVATAEPLLPLPADKLEESSIIHSKKVLLDVACQLPDASRAITLSVCVVVAKFVSLILVAIVFSRP